MLPVVGAYGNAVELFVIYKLLVRVVAADVSEAVMIEFCSRLAGDDIRGGDDLDVGLIHITFDMGFGYPAGADDAYPEFSAFA